MKVYNTRRLNQKQRFLAALGIGIIASIGIGVVSGYLRRWLGLSTGFEFSIVLVGAAYLLAMTIQKIGRGVQERFSILGAFLTVFMCIISNFIYMGINLVGLLNPSAYAFVFSILLQDGIGNLLTLAYHIVAVFVGYNYSRIL